MPFTDKIMNKRLVKNIFLISIPIIVLVLAGATLFGTGIISFEKTSHIRYLSVNVSIDYGDGQFASYNVKILNATAFEALKIASEEYNLDLDTTYYEEYQSHLINKINGVGSTDNKYWIFYINNEMAPVGADQMYLEDGDNISFKLEESTW